MPEYTSIDVGEKLDYTLGWDDQDWLGTDTVASSSWSIVSGGAGLTLTGQTFDATSTTVFGESTASGTWRLRNSITTAGGRKGVEDLVVAARAGATALGYLSPEDAEARLFSRFGIESSLGAGDVAAASSELDLMRPFIGTKLVTDGTQTLEFPRSIKPDGTTATSTVPDAVLDYVALCAYRLSVDDPPPVKSSGAGSVNVTYMDSKASQTDRRMEYLLEPYLLKVGQLVGSSWNAP